MKVVFDTNVYIAAIITEGICSRILRRARSNEFTLVSCPFIMTEIRRNLLKKFHLYSDEAGAIMEVLCEAIAEMAENYAKIEKTCRDSDDDNILACALGAEAAYIVTGDSDLLEIKKFHGIRILTPRDFEALFV